ncbi:MAG: hypothetical protein AB7O60_12495 [Variibacter sp.]
MAKARARRLRPPNNDAHAVARRRHGPAALRVAASIAFCLGLSTLNAAAQPVAVEATLVLAGFDELTGALIVAVSLSDKRPLAALSEANVGHRIEISAHGKRVMRSILREPLRDGAFQMTSSDKDEVLALEAQLAHGPAQLILEVAE